MNILLLNSISRAALLEDEPARGELRPERLGHGAVHHEAETKAQRVAKEFIFRLTAGMKN